MQHPNDLGASMGVSLQRVPLYAESVPSFQVLILERLKAIGMSPAEFARLAGRSKNFGSLLVRGRCKAPKEESEAYVWANILGLADEAREEFVEEAGLSRGLPWVASRFRQMKKDLRRYQR